MPADRRRIEETLDQTLAWSQSRDYLEWTKHDALNSPLLSSLFGGHRVTRILATQAIMRFPVNVRPLLRVPKSENPKGLALFVRALLDAFSASRTPTYLVEAERLLSRLLALRSPGSWHGACWGYQYPWQDLGFFAPRATPNAVVTAFVCEAFLHAYRVTGNLAYLDPVESATEFFRHDLPVLKNADGELCLGYMPMPMTMRVMDVSILVAAVLAQLAAIREDGKMRELVLGLTHYVANRQSPEGAWFYTDPPQDSPVKIDNYHTGFILDGLYRVMGALGNDCWQEHYRRGIEFYAKHLFNRDGSPRWMSDRDYPHDIHGAAQGILTFSAPQNRTSHLLLAERLIDWTLDRMYHPSGYFYYQERHLYRKKVNFLRWCNGWMCHALSSYLLNLRHEEN